VENDQDEDHVIVPRVPLLNTTTRHTLAETIFFLVKDDEAQYRAILSDLSGLVPYEPIDDGVSISPSMSLPYQLLTVSRALHIRTALPIREE